MKCPKCGNDDVYFRILDQGVSNELYKCKLCSYEKFFPSVELTDVMKTAKKISKETKASLLLPIDQTNNIDIKNIISLSEGKFEQSSSGICAMLTAHWIALHYKSANNVDSDFTELVKNNMKQVIADQAAYSSEMSCRQKLAAEAIKAKEDYQNLTGSLSSPDNLPDVTKMTQYGEYIDIDLQNKKKELYKKAIECMDVVNQAAQTEINRMSFCIKDGEQICDDEPITKIVAKILSYGVSPAFYVVNIHNVEGLFKRLLLTGSISHSGHTFGIQIKPPRFRLMDANTGLWSCDSLEMLEELLEKHVNNYYNILGMFLHGTFNLWKYQ